MVSRPHNIGRRNPKARTGCWSCKKRKVKCSEEKPACRACTRLQLPCQYGLRLQWGDDTGGAKELPHLEQAAWHPQIVDEGSKQLHFVHFTVHDFQTNVDDSIEVQDYEDDWESSDRGSASSFGLRSSVELSPSSTSLSMVEEPSWFPPLELSSPLDETLFTYYVREICPRCTMYDDSSNGFRTIIIPMSAHNESVMHSILAVAAFYRRQEDASYHVRALEQKENALIHLRRSYQDDPERRHEEMIATAIMLCVFEIKDGSGPNWDKHLLGGRSILRSKVNSTQHELWSGGISWWANKFFGYQRVNGVSSDQLDDSILLSTSTFWLSQGLDDQEIDGFMGCSSELMAVTSEMSDLARNKYNGWMDEEFLALQSGELERRLFNIHQRSCHAPVILSENSDIRDGIMSCLILHDCSVRAKMLLLTAEARRQAALVFLYTCVRGWAVAHNAVQARVVSCLLCISAVVSLMEEEDSPIWGMTPLIWPLFVSGASTIADEDRYKVADIFAQLRRTKCLGNVARAEETVKSIWKQYDMNFGGSDQPRLWRLYVDPNTKWPLSLG